jgi:hypothetical protein
MINDSCAAKSESGTAESLTKALGGLSQLPLESMKISADGRVTFTVAKDSANGPVNARSLDRIAEGDCSHWCQ